MEPTRHTHTHLGIRRPLPPHGRHLRRLRSRAHGRGVSLQIREGLLVVLRLGGEAGEGEMVRETQGEAELRVQMQTLRIVTA
jgi:hypothetical protein